jgi:hypothetical protein
MILCAERFDRDPTGRSALLPEKPLEDRSGSRELFPMEDLAARQGNLRMSMPLILLKRHQGRRATRRATTTTS